MSPFHRSCRHPSRFQPHAWKVDDDWRGSKDTIVRSVGDIHNEHYDHKRLRQKLETHLPAHYDAVARGLVGAINTTRSKPR